MAVIALGKITVTTAGTIVRVTTTRTTGNTIRFQANSANTGRIYIGTSALVTATLVGCVGILAIPVATTSAGIPYLDFTIPNSPDGINAADFWLDASVNGEGAIVTVLEQ